MDQYTCDLLPKWGLLEYISTFAGDEKESEEHLPSLESPDPGPWQNVEQLWRSTIVAQISILRKGDISRLTEWLRLICRDDLASKSNITGYRICEKHFNEGDILPKPNRKVLKKNALPSLNLPDSHITVQEVSKKEDKTTQTEKAFQGSHVQTTANLSCNTPRKRKLKSELNEYKKKMKLHETMTDKAESRIFHKLCDKFLNKELALIVKAQTDLKINGKGKRYNQEYIHFCLNLYLTSPQAYRLLQSALCLPCTTTLYKHSFPITTEINETAMSILKIKVDKMSEAEKNCSVMIDAMTLKAKNALVIMVRGIFENWKQPVAYVLLSECTNCDEINQWVEKVLIKLFEIGLNIRTFVSDQESDLWIAAKKRLVSTETPYFFVDDRKIYYIFDVPHLIKNVRNNLMQYDFHFGNSVAKFEHIIEFYNQDASKSCRQAHKLTNSHINPTNLEKMKVCYATQLLSKSVASGIHTYIDNKDIDESARDTAKFIKTINDLFDSLNSSNLRHSYKYKRAYAGNEEQIKFFREMQKFFQDLKLINPRNGCDCTSNVKFIEGFQITISSIMQLFDVLLKEGYTFLFTRRLNQDGLQNLFGQIRTKNGMATNPTCRQFVSAFKKLYFCNIIKPPKGGNCADDLGKPLVQTTRGVGIQNFETSAIVNETSDTDDEDFGSSIQITCSDYNQLDMPERN